MNLIQKTGGRSTYNLYSTDRFRAEDKFDAIAYYSTNLNRPDDLREICNVLKEILETPGILNYQQISSLLKLKLLIYNNTPSNTKGASYDLKIDDNHLVSGKTFKQHQNIVIEPLEHVIISAAESLNLPRNIIATFDLKVGMFCKGIILSNGPQIDPGYQGRVLCLLFNSSTKEFSIEQNRADTHLTMQFAALTHVTTHPYRGRYLRKPDIKDYVLPYEEQNTLEWIKEKTKDARIDDLIVKVDNIKPSLLEKFFSYILPILVIVITIGMTLFLFADIRSIGEYKRDVEQHKKDIDTIKQEIKNLREDISKMSTTKADNKSKKGAKNSEHSEK